MSDAFRDALLRQRCSVTGGALRLWWPPNALDHGGPWLLDLRAAAALGATQESAALFADAPPDGRPSPLCERSAADEWAPNPAWTAWRTASSARSAALSPLLARWLAAGDAPPPDASVSEARRRQAAWRRADWSERTGDPETALTRYAEALALAPAWPAPRDGLLRAAERARLHGREDRAEVAWRAVLAARPDDAEALLLLARSAFGARRCDEAVPLLERRLARHGDHAETWLLLGRCRWGRQERDAAEDALLRSAALDPGPAGKALELIAREHENAGDLERADALRVRALRAARSD